MVFQKILDMEESFWKQRARCRWRIEGGKTTKLFHEIVRRKNSKAKFFTINDQGLSLSSQAKIKDLAVSYFSSLLADLIPLSDEPFCIDMSVKVTHEMNMKLGSLLEMEEIKHVVFSINKEASPGPDGYTTHFFQNCWEIEKDDLREAIVDVFNGTSLPAGIYSTTLALIPKKELPIGWLITGL